MIRGLYISASSAIAQNSRIDVITNNLANANTTGFKKDTVLTQSFPEVLIAKINNLPDTDILKNRPASKTFESGKTGDMYAASTNTGFFNVKTPIGTDRSSRIQFTVNEEGFLVTPQGNYVLGLNGPINTGGAAIEVDARGQILANGAVIDRLKVSYPSNVLGNLSYGVFNNEVFTNYAQGPLTTTNNPLDIAIEGKGFFSVETPEGLRFTRNGEFSKSANGFLVTKEGYRVLGENGPIKLDAARLIISEKGEIFDGDRLIDKLKMVDFKDQKALRKAGDGLVRVEEEGRPDNLIEFKGSLKQGFLEGSNVNSVKEMVEMLAMLRTYEANQKLVKIHDEMLGRSVNDIAKL